MSLLWVFIMSTIALVKYTLNGSLLLSYTTEHMVTYITPIFGSLDFSTLTSDRHFGTDS